MATTMRASTVWFLLGVGALAAVVVGSEMWDRRERQDTSNWTRERRAKVAATLAAPVAPKVLAVGAHTLTVVEIPRQGVTPTLLDWDRCFVWRDAEFKTVSMSCGGGQRLRDD